MKPLTYSQRARLDAMPAARRRFIELVYSIVDKVTNDHDRDIEIPGKIHILLDSKTGGVAEHEVVSALRFILERSKTTIGTDGEEAIELARRAERAGCDWKKVAVGNAP